MADTTYDWAMAYHGAGICVLPTHINSNWKAPVLGSWKEYQKKLPTEAELAKWFDNQLPYGIARLNGEISGNMETIDFDIRDYSQCLALFATWWDLVNDHLGGHLPWISVIVSPGPGLQVSYLCEQPIGDGNQKLAYRGNDCIIETRGEGGVALCPGSPANAHPTGGLYLDLEDYGKPPGLHDQNIAHICNLRNLQLTDPDQRDAMVNAARALSDRNSHKSVSEVVQASLDAIDWEGLRLGQAKVMTQSPKSQSPDDETPWEAYNKQTDWDSLLRSLGWQYSHSSANGVEYWTRPGKDVRAGTSLTLYADENQSKAYNYSSSVPLPTGRYLTPFEFLTAWENGGEINRDTQSATARDLRAKGFGGSHFSEDGHLNVKLLTMFDSREKEEAKGAFAACCINSEDLWADDSIQENPVLIDGLFRYHEVINLIGAPKTSKSWFALLMAYSIANGVPFLGREVKQGRVLIIDNELNQGTLKERVGAVRGHFQPALNRNVEVCSIKGKGWGFSQIQDGMLSAYGSGEFDLVILDAFYRFLVGPDANENDNSYITQVYNLLDGMAQAMGSALLCIHHTSKGHQGDKGVTDVGSGAGAQSRAADSHLVLRPHKDTHKDERLVVLEGATRSLPPLEPLVIQYEWPLWHLREDLEPDVQSSLDEVNNKKKARAATADVNILHTAREYLRDNGHTVAASELSEYLMEVSGFGRTKVVKTLKAAVDAEWLDHVKGRGKKPGTYTLTESGDAARLTI